jgi:hypothetical protein
MLVCPTCPQPPLPPSRPLHPNPDSGHSGGNFRWPPIGALSLLSSSLFPLMSQLEGPPVIRSGTRRTLHHNGNGNARHDGNTSLFPPSSSKRSTLPLSMVPMPLSPLPSPLSSSSRVHFDFALVSGDGNNDYDGICSGLVGTIFVHMNLHARKPTRSRPAITMPKCCHCHQNPSLVVVLLLSHTGGHCAP